MSDTPAVEEQFDVVTARGRIPTVRISRLCDVTGLSAVTLRVLAVEYGIRLIRQGSLVHLPIDRIDDLTKIGRAHFRKNEKIFGPRVSPDKVKMLTPKVVKLEPKSHE